MHKNKLLHKYSHSIPPGLLILVCVGDRISLPIYKNKFVSLSDTTYYLKMINGVFLQRAFPLRIGKIGWIVSL